MGANEHNAGYPRMDGSDAKGFGMRVLVPAARARKRRKRFLFFSFPVMAMLLINVLFISYTIRLFLLRKYVGNCDRVDLIL